MAVAIFEKSNVIDTATLAAATAIAASTLMGDLDANFMFKNIRSEIHYIIPDVADKCLLVLANSDATIADITASLSNTIVQRDNGITYANGQQEVRTVWDHRILNYTAIATGGAGSMTINWKIPPKGIPALKGRGLTIFAFNIDRINDYVNGPIVHFQNRWMGGWF